MEGSELLSQRFCCVDPELDLGIVYYRPISTEVFPTRPWMQLLSEPSGLIVLPHMQRQAGYVCGDSLVNTEQATSLDKR